MSFSHISGDWDIYIDEMETPTISDSIGPAMYQLNNLYQNKLEGSYDSFLYIANNDSIPHRLKFVPKPNSNASFTANVEQNTTFLEHDDGSLTFCLNPKPSISCTGATSSVVFEENPDFTAWNSISSIVMNAIEYQKPDGLPDDELLPLLQTNDGDQIQISIGGVHPNRTLTFENLGARSARIKLKLFNGIEFAPSILDQGLNPSNINPTVIFDNENFEVSFCLSVPSSV